MRPPNIKLLVQGLAASQRQSRKENRLPRLDSGAFLYAPPRPDRMLNGAGGQPSLGAQEKACQRVSDGVTNTNVSIMEDDRRLWEETGIGRGGTNSESLLYIEGNVDNLLRPLL